MNTEKHPDVKSSWAGRIFALDLRSLALFRIGWGLIMIWDLFHRWATLRAMYTDQGFFTRQMSYDYLDCQVGPQFSSYFWSLYWIFGSTEFAATLFVVTGMLALLLVIGWQTRVVAVGLFIMLVSLHYRNPMVTQSCDHYFRMLLLWSLFLPWARVWSWDAWRAGRTVANQLTPVANFATVGLICQIIAMYFFGGISKWNEVWLQGDAMWYVLRLDIFVTPLGASLLEYPTFLRFVSWATLFFEVVWVWTLLVPWKNDWFRWSNILVFFGFHLGIGFTMSIGLFPAICILSWIALLPCSVWPSHGENGFVGFDRWADLKPTRRVCRLVCAFLLLFTVVWNVGNISPSLAQKLQQPVVKWLSFGGGLDQRFHMYSRPPTFSPRFVYEAELEDGRRVDLLTEDDAVSERPDSVIKTMPNFHWRKLHRNLVSQRYAFMRQGLADYWVRQWNDSHGPGQQVVAMKLICFMEEIGPSYNEKNVNRVIWASVKTEQAPSGGLFDQLLKTKGDLPF